MLSLWTDSVRMEKKILRPALRGAQKTQALVVGAGLAGVLTAYRLKEAGVQCMVVEAKTIGSGTTGNTTGKITAQHGLCYQQLIKQCGLEEAIRYFQVNTQAIREYEVLCQRHQSDLVSDAAYVYSLTDRKKLDREMDAYRRIGIDPVFEAAPDLPVATVGAVGMRGQARFNPLKLLTALANELTIYENTLIIDIQGNKAITASGSVEAEHIILCSHYPLINLSGGYVLKLYQHRSYVLALKDAQSVAGMYVDEKDDGLSFRMAGDLLLLGGGDHRTGYRGGGYPELRRLAGWAYPNAAEMYHWAAQDTMPLDGRPYIGRFSKKHPNWYVAAGFQKWGMTTAMVAARVLTELVVSGKSAYDTLLDPSRSIWHPKLIVNGFSSAAGLARFGGPRCTHMGCRLKWNALEHTWDCPCHGSRFAPEGKVIDNPAIKKLKDT